MSGVAVEAFPGRHLRAVLSEDSCSSRPARCSELRSSPAVHAQHSAVVHTQDSAGQERELASPADTVEQASSFA